MYLLILDLINLLLLVLKYILSTIDARSYWFLVFVPGKSVSSNCPSGSEDVLNSKLAYQVTGV